MLLDKFSPGKITKKKIAFFLGVTFVITLSGLITAPVSKSVSPLCPLTKQSLITSSSVYSSRRTEGYEEPIEIFKAHPKNNVPVLPPLANGLIVNSYRYIMNRIRKQNQVAKDTLLPGSHAKKQFTVWIVTYWRCGSSFLGDYLQHFPASFYLFEPFHPFGAATRVKEGIDSVEAWKLMENFISCNFNNTDRYLNHIKNRSNIWLQNLSHFRATCSLFEPSCSNPAVLSLACSSSYMNIIKTVRLTLTGSRKLLRANPNLRIIHLVRDPRAIMNSRFKLNWCKNTSCGDSNETCFEMGQDIEEGNKISREFPGRYYRLEFENLAMRPKEETGKLLAYFGWPKVNVLDKYLDDHTNSANEKQNNDPFSTFRKSKDVVHKWKTELNKDEISTINNNCNGVLKLLNQAL